MHDLVVLDNATVGVVVNVEADALRVLTNQVCGPPAGAATGTAGPPPPPSPPRAAGARPRGPTGHCLACGAALWASCCAGHVLSSLPLTKGRLRKRNAPLPALLSFQTAPPYPAGPARQARHPCVPPARHQAQDEQPARQRQGRMCVPRRVQLAPLPCCHTGALPHTAQHRPA